MTDSELIQERWLTKRGQFLAMRALSPTGTGDE